MPSPYKICPKCHARHTLHERTCLCGHAFRTRFNNDGTINNCIETTSRETTRSGRATINRNIAVGVAVLSCVLSGVFVCTTLFNDTPRTAETANNATIQPTSGAETPPQNLTEVEPTPDPDPINRIAASPVYGGMGEGDYYGGGLHVGPRGGVYRYSGTGRKVYGNSSRSRSRGGRRR
jgi:hypothetical protein